MPAPPIVDLSAATDAVRRAAAGLLVDLLPEGWPDLEAARDEVGRMCAPYRVARAALDDDGGLLGWIGAMELYGDHVWEVHPLVVRKDRWRRGIGRALVRDAEARCHYRGVHTLWLGADDHRGETSLAGEDLFPDPLARLATLESRAGHPLGFWRRVGFVVAGVVPDANGRGCPDILMAKRIAPPRPPPDARADGGPRGLA
jgi:aminoglycoside 6'-N-acetyltransferase I